MGWEGGVVFLAFIIPKSPLTGISKSNSHLFTARYLSRRHPGEATAIVSESSSPRVGYFNEAF